MSEPLEGLADYQPEKIKDSSGAIKGIFKNCIFNWVRIEDYEGEIEELRGTKQFHYELEIKDEGDYNGRRIWKTYNLNSQLADKKGKTSAQKLADMLFTLGYSFKTLEELQAIIDQIVIQPVAVRCWIWKRDNGEETQMHQIKSIASVTDIKPNSVPF